MSAGMPYGLQAMLKVRKLLFLSYSFFLSFFLSDVFVSSFYEREMFVFSNDERVLPPSSRKLSIGVDFSL